MLYQLQKKNSCIAETIFEKEDNIKQKIISNSSHSIPAMYIYVGFDDDMMIDMMILL